MILIAQEQNIICSKTIICKQLFAGHVVGSRPMKRKEKIHRMITLVKIFFSRIVSKLCKNTFELVSTVLKAG